MNEYVITFYISDIKHENTHSSCAEMLDDKSEFLMHENGCQSCGLEIMSACLRKGGCMSVREWVGGREEVRGVTRATQC